VLADKKKKRFTLMMRNLLGSAVFSLSVAAMSPLAMAAFQDPVDTPAMMSAQAVSSTLLAIEATGARVVAAGPRGHIVLSDDQGKTWRQAQVPVSTDLVALAFPSPSKGWAVGHGGVLLRSEDFGETWHRVFEGKAIAQLVLEYYQARVSPAAEGATEAEAGPDALPDGEAAGPATAAEAALLQAQRQVEDAAMGAAPPLLDVHFQDENNGFIVGAFNQIIATRDGGVSWQPLFEQVDNPDSLHFYAVAGAGKDVYLAGEQGTVWRLDPASGRFRMVATPYNGTFFGLVASPSSVIAFGMRGSVYRSSDQGASWQRIEIQGHAGIVGGARLADGRIVLVSVAGQVLQSRDDGKTFAVVQVAPAMRSYFGLAAVDGDKLALVGKRGIVVGVVQ
jgi:photosystem II stability/assembly factor-like uncharacterized protein